MDPQQRWSAILAATVAVLGVAGPDTAARQPDAAGRGTPRRNVQPGVRPNEIDRALADRRLETAVDGAVGRDRDGSGGPEPESGFAPPDSIAPYVDLLDVDDFAARLNAAEFIFSTPAVTMDTIQPYLVDPSLAPEARSRLEAIGDVLFRVTSRAAMGVQFERQGVAPIVIRNPVDNNPFFRAHEFIDAGDEVVLADGEPVASYDEFQAAILSHDPLESIRLRIRRAGELIDVEVPLGDYMRLGNGTLPPDHVLRMAWERRLSRIVAAAPSPLRPVLDCRPEGERPKPGRGASADADLGEFNRPPLLVAGGFARGGVAQDGVALEAAPIEMDGTAVEVRDYLRQQGLAEAQVREVERQLEPLLAMHKQLVEVRLRCRENIAQTRVLLQDETLDPALRLQLTDRLARLEQTLEDAQRQLDAITMVLPLGR